MPKVNLNNRVVRQLVRQAISDVDDALDAAGHQGDDCFVPRRYHELADQLKSEEQVTLKGVPLNFHTSTGFYA